MQCTDIKFLIFVFQHFIRPGSITTSAAAAATLLLLLLLLPLLLLRSTIHTVEVVELLSIKEGRSTIIVHCIQHSPLLKEILLEALGSTSPSCGVDERGAAGAGVTALDEIWSLLKYHREK